MCPGGQATLFKGSGEQQPWQQLQMSSLHMYDPCHWNTTQSITHRLQWLSTFSLVALLLFSPAHPSQALTVLCLSDVFPVVLCSQYHSLFSIYAPCFFHYLSPPPFPVYLNIFPFGE